MSDVVQPLRYLHPAFLDALDDLSERETSWWRDVLGHKELYLAVRMGYINVYYGGASIYRIKWENGDIIPYTHFKYLIGQKQYYVPMREHTRFEIDGIESMVSNYQGRETLDGMIRASRPYAGLEKIGLHPMLVGNGDVIDAELALVQTRSADLLSHETMGVDGEVGRKEPDRIDAATVTIGTGDQPPKVHFYEAKHFTNPALRASGEREPAVVSQIRRYGQALERHKDGLSKGYIESARALMRFNAMRRRAFGEGMERPIAPAIRQIAEGRAAPVIDREPYLLIYGYDNAQKIDEAWNKHLGKLKTALPNRVQTVGRPTSKTRFLSAR